jgi:uncharacterized coiled-coil protein SlyX
MSNGNIEDRVLSLEQRQQQQDRAISQINEILLVVAQRLNETSDRLNETIGIQQRNSRQIEANTVAIAELRAAIER